MFSKKPQEQLKEITSIPQSSVGAPCPLVYSTEFDLYVTFFLQEYDPNWDGTSVKIVDADTIDEPSIVVTFNRVLAHYFGVPNDEAISGHPLSGIGLEPYSYFEVLNSRWLEKHEKMNRVHLYHKKEHYNVYRHFIFTFHDTTLEVLASEYSIEISNLSLKQNIENVMKIQA